MSLIKQHLYNQQMSDLPPMIEISRSQADTLLWCIEQMFIDLSDAEERDLAPIIEQLADIVK